MKSIRLQAFLLMIAGTATVFAQPTITAVLDGAALTANLAQGSVFVVKGTGLSNAGDFFQADAPTYPTSFHNVGITLTPASGGTALNMLMVYVYNQGGVNQLAAVIPSTVAAGSYNLKVTFNGASSANFATSVVTRKPGIVTADGSGSGIAQATLQGQAILQRNSNVGKIGVYDTRPAHPNDIMTLWGTGLGADVAADTGGSSGDQTAAGAIRVVLNGNDITPSYAGRSQGYPGLDQVNFAIPGGVNLSCTNTVQVRAGGVSSNSTTIATAAAGSDVCPPAVSGNLAPNPTQTEINSWIALGKYNTGAVSMLHTIGYNYHENNQGTTVASTSTFDGFSASFNRLSGPNLTKSLTTTSPNTPVAGTCIIDTDYNPGVTITGLNAGNTLTVNGTGGLQTATYYTPQPGVYISTIPSGYITPEKYTFKGTGGPDVGAFTGTLDMSPPLVWTNYATAAVITRGAGLTVTWTGGDTTALMTLYGQSVDASNKAVQFHCWANNSSGSGSITVPASILTQLPASPVSGATITRGSIVLYSFFQNRLTAPGMDFFTADGEWLVDVQTQYK